ncbi:site-2 protease family protein [Paludisphaera sp.]|uniref:site-2 protease family protein n=1 Tax=Paludisphaera sp. TaxID=2017432 RepID=UPI00301C4C89
MFTDTAETRYDLRFQILGIPVRVHPWFWVISALLGASGEAGLGVVLAWVGCVFVSILVHELGHALMGRRFGSDPSILLYSFGGLCYTGGERTPGQRLAVLLAGPAAGVSLYLATIGAYSLAYGITPREHLALSMPFLGLEPDAAELFRGVGKIGGYQALVLYSMLVQINLYWSIINLMPIWPLDGGQATQVVLSQVNRREGARWGHGISFVTAGLLALFLGIRGQNMFMTIFMGYFAFINYQALHSLHEASRFGGRDDWWRS